MKCKNINGKIQKNKQKTNGKFRVNNIEKQELKDQGVTMLSLVVTIVILLILSGITIKFALDDNGIIKQSKLASEKYKNSTIQEQRTLNEISKEMSTTSSNGGTSGGNSSEADNYDEIKQENEELKNEIKKLKENQATGNATTSQVLSGATFSTSAGIGLTGTMTNNGTWTANTTGSGNITIPAGYHNGKGYVSGAGAYNKGVSDADARINTDSASYKSGYTNGSASATVKRVVVGTVSGASATFSVANITGFQNLTAANFAFVPSSIAYAFSYDKGDGGAFNGNVNLSSKPTISYNQSNGAVTVSGFMNSQKWEYIAGSNYQNYTHWVQLKGTLYCYYS